MAALARRRRWSTHPARLLAPAAAIAALAAEPCRAEPEATSEENGDPPALLRPLLDPTPGDGTPLRLEVEYPQDGAVIADFICGAFISGRAHAGQSGFDVAIVLDTSRSTIDPSGADVDGDGVVGTTVPDRGAAIFHAANSDPDDSILAAEVAAARELLGQLDPGITRVSLVAFSGDPRGLPGATPEPAATVLEPLTSDFPRIEAALDELRRQVPRGATHMAAGLDRARIALAEPSGGSSDAEREKVVFFFTDGQPTLPHGPGLEAANILEVLDAVGRAERAGLRIHSFAIGAEALEGPLAVVEMARQTGGYFVPVRRPGDLVHAVGEVSLARLSEVRVSNRTTGEEAPLLRTLADGTWGGFVPLKAGDNAIEIAARADDGTEVSRTLAVRYEEEARPLEIPPDIAALRGALLEDCLAALRRVNLELERERNERVRRELALEIERERKRRELRLEIERERRTARRRATEQRKRLEITVEEEEAATP